MANSSVCSCHQNGGKKIHNYFILETMLPVEYNYLICTYTEVPNQSITSRLHLNCMTKDEAFEWLEKCSSITKVTFSFEKQDNTINARCLCMKNNTRCKTVIKIQFAPSNPTNASPINQSILHEYPATVSFHYTHDFNEISDMLIEEVDVDECNDTNDDSSKTASIIDSKKPKPKSEVIERFVHQKLYSMFDKDYNAKEVYSLCKTEIVDLFAKHNTDKMLRPGVKWVYDQYYNYIQYKDDIEANKKRVSLEKKLEKSRLDSAKKETVTVNKPLNSKIDELCKKYKPILPASSPRKDTSELDSSVSASLSKSIQSTEPTPSTTPFILKLNPELKSEKLNLVPVKLLPNDVMIQNKLPDLKSVSNNKVTPLLKLLAADSPLTQNISVPSCVNGIIILANHNKQTSTNNSSLNISSNQKPAQTASVPPRIRKHPRKSSLKCEDPGDIVFTDRIEDLLSNGKKKLKKSRRKSARIASKKKVVQSKTKSSRTASKKKVIKSNTKSTRTASKKKKVISDNSKSTRVASKNKKVVQYNAKSTGIARKKRVVQCHSISDIENVICTN